MRKILIHHRLHNFSRLGKADRARKVFGSRAKTLLLTSPENDGAEMTLFYKLAAKE
jgi:hypothetical protein